MTQSVMRKLSTAKRLAVIGNCQAPSLAHCLRAANPALDVVVVEMARHKSGDAQQNVLHQLETTDVVLVQTGGDGLLDSGRLRERFENVILYPKLTFYGFHPDFFYLRGADGSPVRSACGLYHSRIVAAAYCGGLPKERVEALFNAFVFSRLGYLTKFVPWKKTFLARAGEIGYHLEKDFEVWLKEGAFMHTLNHPTIRVVASVASQIMRETGLNLINSPAAAPDPLASAAQLPVYADIAEAIGIRPRPNFRVPNRDKRGTRDLSLSDFIEESYRIYRGFEQYVFQTEELNHARAILDNEIVGSS